MTVPCWATICCEEDLRCVETQAELDELLAFNEDDGNDLGLLYRFWRTKEEALAELI